MPKTLVCGLPLSGGQIPPVRTWIPRAISLESASQLCNSSLSGKLSDFSNLEELQEALYIITGSGLPTTLVESLWLPYRRNDSGNNFINIYSGNSFNASLWTMNQPGANRDCVACDESGCHSEDCQAFRLLLEVQSNCELLTKDNEKCYVKKKVGFCKKMQDFGKIPRESSEKLSLLKLN
jgi:hypothetical protein